MSFERKSVVGSSLLGSTLDGVERISTFQLSVQLVREERERALIGSALAAPGGPGADSIAWELDNLEISVAIQERIDQQLPDVYQETGLVGNFSGQPFQYRTWEDLCGIEQLYSDLRHYTGPILSCGGLCCVHCATPQLRIGTTTSVSSC